VKRLRSLERALLRRLRQAREQSPALWKEDRDARKRIRKLPPLLGQFWPVLPVLLFTVNARTDRFRGHRPVRGRDEPDPHGGAPACAAHGS